MIKAIAVGNAVRDAELSYTPNTQTAVCKFTIASNDRAGGENEDTDYLVVKVFGKQAEICDRYVKKGKKVAVSGRLKLGHYINKDGNRVNTTELIADSNGVEFLSGGSARQEGAKNAAYGDSAPPQEPAGNVPPAMPEQMEMDLPDSFQAAEGDIPF